MTTETLKAAKSDQDALARVQLVYRDFGLQVLRERFPWVTDPQSQYDIVTEATEKAVKKFDPAQGPFAPWLANAIKITVRTRARASVATEQREGAYALECVPATVPHEFDALDKERVRHDALEASLAQQPRQLQRAFRAHLAGAQWKEIALPPGRELWWVEAQFRRWMNNFREYFKTNYPEYYGN